jgi:hypothetical protein
MPWYECSSRVYHDRGGWWEPRAGTKFSTPARALASFTWCDACAAYMCPVRVLRQLRWCKARGCRRTAAAPRRFHPASTLDKQRAACSACAERQFHLFLVSPGRRPKNAAVPLHAIDRPSRHRGAVAMSCEVYAIHHQYTVRLPACRVIFFKPAETLVS